MECSGEGGEVKRGSERERGNCFGILSGVCSSDGGNDDR